MAAKELRRGLGTVRKGNDRSSSPGKSETKGKSKYPAEVSQAASTPATSTPGTQAPTPRKLQVNSSQLCSPVAGKSLQLKNLGKVLRVKGVMRLEQRKLPEEKAKAAGKYKQKNSSAELKVVQSSQASSPLKPQIKL